MQLGEYVRLGLGGLFLDQHVYRQQRDAPDTLKRGFILVLLVGLLVGAATIVGHLGETMASRNRADVNRVIYEGLIEMPWYQSVRLMNPDFDQQFEQNFNAVTQVLDMFDPTSGGVVGVLIDGVTVPVRYALAWLIYGVVAFGMARMLGGTGSLAQTLGCTALAAGANLLELVQFVPFADTAGVTVLALLASYIALREAHELTPWRAFWATLLGPLLLVVLVGIVLVVLLLVVGGSA
jgi:hypothetical protein